MYLKCTVQLYYQNRSIGSGLGIGRYSILNYSDQGQNNLIGTSLVCVYIYMISTDMKSIIVITFLAISPSPCMF